MHLPVGGPARAAEQRRHGGRGAGPRRPRILPSHGGLPSALSAVRAKFDSADIVQSIWADLPRGFRKAGWRFAEVDHLGGFLFVATHNCLIDRVRQCQQVVDREVPLGEGRQQELLQSPKPQPGEVARANGIWERILTRSLSEHRPILALGRNGHSLAEIAGRAGLHPDSVRRIPRIIAGRLASEQEAAEAERGGLPGDPRIESDAAFVRPLRPRGILSFSRPLRAPGLDEMGRDGYSGRFLSITVTGSHP
jgi:DNA-directed RNA polymerase specialized sigma24 family protein